jgi:transcriptional regulator with XRE-family HTH domain
MTGSELRQALAALDMKQQTFAELAGVRPEQISRMAHDRTPVSRAVETIIGLLIERRANAA